MKEKVLTMIDPTAVSHPSDPGAAAPAHSRKVLRMVKNERMGGSVPVWESANNSRQKIEENLTRAITGYDPKTFKNTLAYQNAQGDMNSSRSKEFGFGDLVDMLNPLQHIPIVNHLYRHLTGDEIKPISSIVGGAVFGGPIGAASGLVNAIAKEETGKDIAGNAMAFAFNGEKPNFKSHAYGPEEHLTASLKSTENVGHIDLPGSVISFADLGGGASAFTERAPVAEGRTAGTMIRKHPAQPQTVAYAPPLDLLALASRPE